MSNVARKVKDGEARYDFTCEGCGSKGELRVPLDIGTKQLLCPEGCGAVYIQWKNLDGKWQLTCVVCPVFEEGADA